MHQVLMQRGSHSFIRYCASESVFAGLRRIAKLATSIAIAVAFTGIALPTPSAQAQTATLAATGNSSIGDGEEKTFTLTLDELPTNRNITHATVTLIVRGDNPLLDHPSGTGYEGASFDVIVTGDNGRAVTLNRQNGAGKIQKRMSVTIPLDPTSGTAGAGQPAVITYTVRGKSVLSDQSFSLATFARSFSFRDNNSNDFELSGLAVTGSPQPFTVAASDDRVLLTYGYPTGATIPNFKAEEPDSYTGLAGNLWSGGRNLLLASGVAAHYTDGTVYQCAESSTGNCVINLGAFSGDIGRIVAGGPVHVTALGIPPTAVSAIAAADAAEGDDIDVTITLNQRLPLTASGVGRVAYAVAGRGASPIDPATDVTVASPATFSADGTGPTLTFTIAANADNLVESDETGTVTVTGITWSGGNLTGLSESADFAVSDVALPPPVAEPQEPRLIYTYENLEQIPVDFFHAEEPTNASATGVTWTDGVSLALTQNAVARYDDGTTYTCLSGTTCVITFANRQINNGGQVQVSAPFDTAAQFLPDALGAKITFNRDSKITNREPGVAGGRLPAPHTASINESAGDVAVFDVDFSGIPDNVTRAQCVYGLGGTAQYKDEDDDRDYALLNDNRDGVIELTDGNFFAEANINEGDLPTPQDQEDAIDGVNHRFTVDCGSTNANASWKTNTYTRSIRIYDDSTDEEAESIAIFLRQVNLFVGTNGTDELGSVRLPPRETVGGEIVVLPDTLLLTINDNDAPTIPRVTAVNATRATATEVAGATRTAEITVTFAAPVTTDLVIDYGILGGDGFTAADIDSIAIAPGDARDVASNSTSNLTEIINCADIRDLRCGTLTFNGSASFVIAIAANDDAIPEADEAFTFFLRGRRVGDPPRDEDGDGVPDAHDLRPVNVLFPEYPIGTPEKDRGKPGVAFAARSARIDITDDDAAPPVITANTYVGNSFEEPVGEPEDEDSLNFTFSLDSVSTGTVLGYRFTGIEIADILRVDNGFQTEVTPDSDDPRQGTFVVNNSLADLRGGLNIVAAADNVLEGRETVTFTAFAGHPDSTRLELENGTHTIALADTTPVTARLTWAETDTDTSSPIGESVFPGGALEGASPHILLDLRRTIGVSGVGDANIDDTVTVARDMFFPITCTTLGGCGAAATPADRRALEAQIERTIDDRGTTSGLTHRSDDLDLYGVVLRAGQSQEGVGVDLLNDERFDEGDEVLTLAIGDPTGFRDVALPAGLNIGLTNDPITRTATAEITIRNRPSAAEGTPVTWRPESQDSTQDVTTGAGAVRTKVSELVLELAGGFTGDHQGVSVVYRYETNTGDVPDASLGSLEWWVLNLADGSRLRRLAIGDVSGSISDVITVSRTLFSPIQDGTPTVRVGLFFSPTAAPGVGGDLVLNVKNVRHIDGITGTSDRVMCSDDDTDNFQFCPDQEFNVGESLVELTSDRTASEAGSETGSVTFRFTPLNMAGNPVYPALATSANVPYSIGGTATRGQTTSDGDYVLTMRTSSDEAGNTLTTGITFSDEAITIPGDNRTDYITFIVTPNTDGVNERDETVIITIGSTDPGITFTASTDVVRFARATTITIENQRVVTLSFHTGAETNFRVQEGMSGQTTPGAGQRNLQTNQNSPKARLIVEDVPADAGGYIHYMAVRSQVTSGSATYGGGTTGDGRGGAANSDYMLARGFSLSPTQWITQDSTIYVDRSTQMGPNPQTNNLQNIFNPGSNQFDLDFWAVTAADTLDEPPETINMRFSVSVERCIARGTCSPGTDRETVGGAAVINATFTMNDEDSLVRSLVIQTVGDSSADSVAEGENMDVTLTLNDRVPRSEATNFAYTITDATNAANTDNAAGFVAADLDNPALATGNVTVSSPGGSLSRFQRLRLTIADDDIPEGAETLRFTLAPKTYTGESGTSRNIATGPGSSYADFTIAASDDGGGPVGSIVDISSRSQAVRNAILAALELANPAAVPADRLAEITDLNFLSSVFLLPGDLDGLTGLINLNLVGYEMGELVPGVFDGLTSLERLRLGGNALTSLPPGIFDDLTSLQLLALDGNALASLRSDTFGELGALSTLNLDNNALKNLPENLFTGTGGISELTLHNNLFTPDTGLPVGVFDNILGSLGTITTTYNGGVDNFQIDDTVRAAHFVCSRDDADAIVTATDGVADCLRITAEQFDTYAGTRFSASFSFDSSLTEGSGSVRFIDEGTGSALSASGNAGVAVVSREFNNSPAGTLSYTCVFNVSGTAELGVDYFLKRGGASPGDDVGTNDAVLPFEGTANAAGTSGTLTDIDCGPGTTEDLTYNIRIINDTVVESGDESVIVSLASVQAFDAANSGGNPLGTANVVAGTAGSTTLTVVITDDEDAAAIVNISDRTDAVENAILAAVAATDPTAVPREQLAAITRLEIPNGSTDILANGDFANLTNLHTLDMSSVGLTALPANVFVGLSRLEILWLSRNNFTTLPATVFDPLVSLRQLGLSRNARLTSLHANQFAMLRNLRVLWVGRLDSLTSLDATVFDDLVNLRELQLWQNSLISSGLHANQFAGLSQLRILSLSGRDATDASSPVEVTNLTSLPDGVFNGLTNLQDLRLQNNDLTALRANAFSGLNSLQMLNISGNALTAALAAVPATTFQNLPALRRLTLTDNGITAVDSAQFRGLPRLEELDLTGNALTALPADVFDDLDGIEQLYLGGNPFTANTGLPAGIFDKVLDTLAIIGTGNDRVVHEAHFVCSLSNVDDIVAATPGAFDCLRVTVAELAAFNDTFFSGIRLADGFGTGIFAGQSVFVERSVDEDSGTTLAETTDVGVAFMVQDFGDIPSGAASYTCIFTVGGTAQLGADYFFKDDDDDSDVDHTDSDFSGTAGASGTSGTFTDTDCAPVSETSVTYNIRIINDDDAEDDETIIITYVSVEAFDAANSGGNSLGSAAIEEPSTLTITITEPPVGPAARIVGTSYSLQDDGESSAHFAVQIRNYSFPTGESTGEELDALVVSMGISRFEETRSFRAIRSDGPGNQQEFVSSPTDSADINGAQSLDGNLFNLSLRNISGISAEEHPYLISSGGSGAFLLVVPEAFFATADSGSDANGANITINIAAADIESEDYERDHSVGFSANDGRGIFVAQGTSGVNVVETNAEFNVVPRSAATGNVVYNLVPAPEPPTASITTTGPLELIRGNTVRTPFTISASNLILVTPGNADTTLVTFRGTVTGPSGETDTYVREEDFRLYDAAADGNQILVGNDNTFAIELSGAMGDIENNGTAEVMIYLAPQSGPGDESFFITLTSAESCTNDGRGDCAASTQSTVEVVGLPLRVNLTAPPTVSVAAEGDAAIAMEGSTPGFVTFTLSEDAPAGGVTVDFTSTSVAGGAIRGSCTLGTNVPGLCTGGFGSTAVGNLTYVLAERTGTVGDYSYEVLPISPDIITSFTIAEGDDEYVMAVITVAGDEPETITITATEASGDFEVNAEADAVDVTAIDPGTAELERITGDPVLSVGGRNQYRVSLDNIGVSDTPGVDGGLIRNVPASSGGVEIDAVIELTFPDNPDFGPLPTSLRGDVGTGANAIAGNNYDVFLEDAAITDSANYDISLSGNVITVIVKQSRLRRASGNRTGGQSEGGERFLFTVIPKVATSRDVIIGMEVYTVAAGTTAENAGTAAPLTTLAPTISDNTFSAIGAPTATLVRQLDEGGSNAGVIPTTADTDALALTFTNPFSEDLTDPKITYTLRITPTGNDGLNPDTAFDKNLHFSVAVGNTAVTEFTTPDDNANAREFTVNTTISGALAPGGVTSDLDVTLGALTFPGANRTFDIALTNVRVQTDSETKTLINSEPLVPPSVEVSVAASPLPTATLNLTGSSEVEVDDGADGGLDTTTFEIVLDNIPTQVDLDGSPVDTKIVRIDLDFSRGTIQDSGGTSTAFSATDNVGQTDFFSVTGMTTGITAHAVTGETRMLRFELDDDVSDFVDVNDVNPQSITLPFTIDNNGGPGTTGNIVVTISAVSYLDTGRTEGTKTNLPLEADPSADPVEFQQILSPNLISVKAVAAGTAAVASLSPTGPARRIAANGGSTDITVSLANVFDDIGGTAVDSVRLTLTPEASAFATTVGNIGGTGKSIALGTGESAFRLTLPDIDRLVFMANSPTVNENPVQLSVPAGTTEFPITVTATGTGISAEGSVRVTGITYHDSTPDVIPNGPSPHFGDRSAFTTVDDPVAANLSTDQSTEIGVSGGGLGMTEFSLKLTNLEDGNMASVPLTFGNIGGTPSRGDSNGGTDNQIDGDDYVVDIIRTTTDDGTSVSAATFTEPTVNDGNGAADVEFTAPASNAEAVTVRFRITSKTSSALNFTVSVGAFTVITPVSGGPDLTRNEIVQTASLDFFIVELAGLSSISFAPAPPATVTAMANGGMSASPHAVVTLVNIDEHITGTLNHADITLEADGLTFNQASDNGKSITLGDSAATLTIDGVNAHRFVNATSESETATLRVVGAAIDDEDVTIMLTGGFVGSDMNFTLEPIAVNYYSSAANTVEIEGPLPVFAEGRFSVDAVEATDATGSIAIAEENGVVESSIVVGDVGGGVVIITLDGLGLSGYIASSNELADVGYAIIDVAFGNLTFAGISNADERGYTITDNGDSTVSIAVPRSRLFASTVGISEEQGDEEITINFTASAEGSHPVSVSGGLSVDALNAMPLKLNSDPLDSDPYDILFPSPLPATVTFTAAPATATLTAVEVGDEDGPVNGQYTLLLTGVAVPTEAVEIPYTIPAITVVSGTPDDIPDATPGADYDYTLDVDDSNITITQPEGTPADGYTGTITIGTDAYTSVLGIATVQIDINIIPRDDDIVEGTEDVRLMIPTLPFAATYTFDSAQKVRITDADDDTAIVFIGLDSQVLENGTKEDIDDIREGFTYPVQIFIKAGTLTAEIDNTVLLRTDNNAVLSADATFMLTLMGGTDFVNGADVAGTDADVRFSDNAGGNLRDTVTVTIPAGESTGLAYLTIRDDNSPAGKVFAVHITNTATDPAQPVYPFNGAEFRAAVAINPSGGGGITIASGAGAGFCAGRTPAVADAILDLVQNGVLPAYSGAQRAAATCGDVTDVTDLELEGIRMLDLSGDSLTSLQPGDFADLDNLTTLNLSSNSLRALPAGVFPDDLDGLTSLDLSGNSLTTAGIPDDVFNELDALDTLNLDDNATLTALPDNVLDDVLDNLTALTLDDAAKRYLTFAAGAYDVTEGGNVTITFNITDADGNPATTPVAAFVVIDNLTTDLTSGDDLNGTDGVIVPVGSSSVDVLITATDDAIAATLEFGAVTLGTGDSDGFTGLNSLDVGVVSNVFIPDTPTGPEFLTETEVTVLAPVVMVASIPAAAELNNVQGVIDLTLNRRVNVDPADTDTGTADVTFTLAAGGATLALSGSGTVADPFVPANADYLLAITRPDGTPVQAGGDGINDTDFSPTATGGTFRLAAGDNGATFTITPIADGFPDTANREGPEDVTITVTQVDYNGTAAPDAATGLTAADTITITDNTDEPTAMLRGLPTLITESDGVRGTFTINLANAPEGVATVAYTLRVASAAISPGSITLDGLDGEPPAASGDTGEFTMTVGVGQSTAEGMLAFSAGRDNDQTHGEVSLTVDGVEFPDTGRGTNIEGPAAATITINDADPVFTICDRTDAVETAILSHLSATDCMEVMDGSSDLTGLNPPGGLTVDGLSGLTAGDFADLTSLQSLTLNGSFTSLPAGVFDDLGALTSLTIDAALTGLPAGVFGNLIALETLNIAGSTTLTPTDGALEGVLDTLTSLTWPTTPAIATFVEDGITVGQTGTTNVSVRLDTALPAAVSIPVTAPTATGVTIGNAIIPAGSVAAVTVTVTAENAATTTNSVLRLGTPVVLGTVSGSGTFTAINPQRPAIRTELIANPSDTATLTVVSGPTVTLAPGPTSSFPRDGDGSATFTLSFANIPPSAGTGNIAVDDVFTRLTFTGAPANRMVTAPAGTLTPGGSPAGSYYDFELPRADTGTIIFTITSTGVGAENFMVTLTSSILRNSSDAEITGGASATVGLSGSPLDFTILAPPNEVEVTLDPATATSIAEANGSVDITVSLNRAVLADNDGDDTTNPNVNLPFTIGGGADTEDYTITFPTGGGCTNTCVGRVGTTNGSGTLVFAADATAQTHTIRITATSDLFDDGDETIIFTLTPPAPPNGVTVGNDDAVTITISDDDVPPNSASASIPEAQRTIDEDGGVSSITVRLSPGAVLADGHDVHVGFTIGGTANTDDYTIAFPTRGDCINTCVGRVGTTNGSGTLVFGRNEGPKTITITARTDEVEEDPDETILFSLTSATTDSTPPVPLSSFTPTAPALTITIEESTVELEEVMMQVETVATVVATEHVSALTSLIRQRFSATSSFASPPRVPTGAVPAPSTTTNLSLADSPETMNDMINSMGLESSAQGDSNDHYAVWIRGQRSAFEGTPEIQGLTVNYDGTSTGIGMGAEYVSGEYLMGLAMNYVSTEVDLSTEGGEGSESITKYDESIVIAAPYLSMKAGRGTSLWASVGYGSGTADAKLADETKSADVALSFLNAGADFTVIGMGFEIVTGLSGLAVRKVVDAFTFADVVIPETTIDTTQGVAEITVYRPIHVAGQILRPYVGVSTIHDFGDIVADDDHGLGIRSGVAFGLGRISTDIEFSSELLRENRRQWTVSGGMRFAARPGGKGLSLSLEGTQETLMDTEDAVDDADQTWGVGLEGGYGMPMGLFHSDGVLTPFAGVDQTGNGRDMSGGMRFSVGNGLSLDLETTRQMHDDGEDASEHKAGLRGKWSF